MIISYNEPILTTEELQLKPVPMEQQAPGTMWFTPNAIHMDGIRYECDNPKFIFANIIWKYFRGRTPEIIVGGGCRFDLGVVLGCEGFSHVRDNNGRWFGFPHIGGVRIGAGVEIGANSVIDRGTLGDTIIGDGTKIAHLVHVAHNCQVGKHVYIGSHAQLSGSSKVGDYTFVGAASMIRNGTRVGSNCLIGIGSVVLKDVPDGKIAYGNPCKAVMDNPEKY